MVKRLTLLLLVLALADGVVSGTPLHSANSQMMKCCDKAKSKDKTPKAEAARLCCAVNCSESAPTSFGNSCNFAPSNNTVTKSIIALIAALFANEKAAPVGTSNVSRQVLLRTLQPKYIQHNSLLI